MSNLADELRDAIALMRGMESQSTKAPWHTNKRFAAVVFGDGISTASCGGILSSAELSISQAVALGRDNAALIVATRNTLAASLDVMDAIRQVLEDGLSNPYLELQVRAWIAAVREVPKWPREG